MDRSKTTKEATVPLTPPPVRAAALAELRTSFVRFIGGFDPFGRYRHR